MLENKNYIKKMAQFIKIKKMKLDLQIIKNEMLQQVHIINLQIINEEIYQNNLELQRSHGNK
jgi:hypothetical protein